MSRTLRSKEACHDDRRRTAAHRASGGVDVYLFWNEPTSRVTVGVLGARGDDRFEFEVTDGTRSTPSTSLRLQPSIQEAHARTDDSPALTVPGA